MEFVKRQLARFSRKTIRLDELEDMMQQLFATYEDFAYAVLQLEDEGVLLMVKSKGRTTRVPSLAFQYRINKSYLSDSHHKQLQQLRITLHPLINLDHYYDKDPTLLEKDLPYILKVDDYVKTSGLPTDIVPGPERSFELVGDEKWFTEKGGKELLERIGMLDHLHVIPVSEPLMFAINPQKILASEQYHLIVENKTTYQGLLPALQETMFSTLIYGAGKAVIKSMEQFPFQYPVKATHHFYYFGDLDKEGIAIWHSLNHKQPAIPALPFYVACLDRGAVKGKAYQRENKVAIDNFLACFSSDQQVQIRELLNDGYYYPQEILKMKELQRIWRESTWRA